MVSDQLQNTTRTTTSCFEGKYGISTYPFFSKQCYLGGFDHFPENIEHIVPIQSTLLQTVSKLTWLQAISDNNGILTDMYNVLQVFIVSSQINIYHMSPHSKMLTIEIHTPDVASPQQSPFIGNNKASVCKINAKSYLNTCAH